MKVILVSLILVAVLITAVQAGDLNISVKSLYVGSVSGSVFYDGPVLQADHTWTVGKSSYVGLWGSLGLDGDKKGANFGNEVDVYAGTTVGKADIGLNYYNMGELDRLGDDCLALYTNLPLGKIAGWNAKLHAEYDWATDKDALDGNMYVFSADKKFGKDTLQVNVGGHFKAFGIPTELVSFAGLEYIKPVSKNTSLTLRGQLATHDWGMADDALIAGLAVKL